MFPVLLLRDVLEDTHAIGRALLHQRDIRMGNGVICEFNIEFFVVPMVVDVQSRREADVHVPMVIMGLLCGIPVYLDGAKPFQDLLSPAPYLHLA